MRPIFRWLVAAALVGAAVFWVVTIPGDLPEEEVAGLTGDAGRGETLFWAAGCANCHAAPGAEGEARLVLAGGQRFASPFGTFLAPNISPSEEGIGDWSLRDFARAMTMGVNAEGQHLFPAFPYNSYDMAEMQDVADIHAYMMTLPADASPSQPHEVGFPFNIRRSLGGWKLLFMREGWQVEGELTEEQLRGRYLVEVLGHCGECHTPRNPLGGWTGDWLAGAPSPDGKGRIPNITPGKLDWSEGDIAEYLKSGFTPEFDTAGGEMATVVQSTSRLTDEDRAAIAAYLKVVPPVAN
ncbi:cytochrome c [Vannielia litorea]|uniref:Cytochrome c, mono-and diheme variants n=1 Tax=Vannielia litorea TaxID=1217970 RepID=A0A1N6FA75_9RHOB|nr:cytochrome c [Vannielia litorea]SIN92185.1 Cytochrome c, mono-and diheme variants [Vannielia litorea]